MKAHPKALRVRVGDLPDGFAVGKFLGPLVVWIHPGYGLVMVVRKAKRGWGG